MIDFISGTIFGFLVLTFLFRLILFFDKSYETDDKIERVIWKIIDVIIIVCVVVWLIKRF